MQVLVTGATGAVGPSVVHACSNAGCCVRTLSRDLPAAGLLPTGIEARIGDVTDPAAVQSAVEGIDVVLHLAALLHINNPPAAVRDAYTRVNVEGTRLLVDAAVKAGVKRLVFFSTIAVYGNAADRVVTEVSTPAPNTHYAQTKLQAEQLVLAAHRSDGRPLGTVLRLGAVYGARVKGNYRRLLQSLARRRFVPIGSGLNRRTLVYDKDVAAAAVLAAQHPAAAGRVYNVSDGEYHTLREIIATMCTALGRTPPRLSLPIGPVRLAAGVVEDMGRLLGRRSPIMRATVDKYTEDMAVSSQRIQTELGFIPRYGLAAGWEETVAELRRMGQL